ncbi:MAG: transcription termination/antitermination protein NusA [Rhodobacteraceae bacterium]|nr:transcription termination/antitermination protein NusA [Paracoccaceae bacterium]
MSIATANMLELLQIADSVAQEKMIDNSIVIEAIEEALAKAARMHYGPELDIRVKLDPATGHQTYARFRTVVENVENRYCEIEVDEARAIKEDAAPGEELSDMLPHFDMGRIAAQSAKQVVLQKIREAERERQYHEFKDRVGSIIVGTVKREEYGSIIVDITRAEAILRRDQRIGREGYGNGERLRAYISDVRRETRGPQIFLSRTANQFMVELFRSEVPEINDGSIEIRSVAREPGSRAKIAVVSYDASIDPVGACVGMRGSRVQAVVNELQGERIDIIPWTDNLVDFIVTALQPAVVAKVILDDEGIPNIVVVPDDQFSLAVGRRGQNVRLACRLTGLEVSILTETQEKEQRQADVAKRTKLIMDAIDIDEVFAHLLVSEGFDSPDYLATCNLDELCSLDGIDLAIAEELQTRAVKVVEAETEEAFAKARELGLQDDLAEFPGLSPKMILALVENQMVSVQDLAYCEDWEIAGGTTYRNGKRHHDVGYLEAFDVSLEEAGNLIMQARIAAGLVDEEAIADPAQEDEALEDIEAGPELEEIVQQEAGAAVG